MRIVLDTNILVSALLARGGPWRIVEAVRDGESEIVTSPILLAELERILNLARVTRRARLSHVEVAGYLEELRKLAIVIEPAIRLSVVIRDPDDDRVLEAAVAGSAEYVVTSDRDLLDLREYEGIRIVTPAVFLPLLRELS